MNGKRRIVSLTGDETRPYISNGSAKWGRNR